MGATPALWTLNAERLQAVVREPRMVNRHLKKKIPWPSLTVGSRGQGGGHPPVWGARLDPPR